MDFFKNDTTICCCLQETCFSLALRYLTESEGMEKKDISSRSNQKKQGEVAILISDRTDFKLKRDKERSAYNEKGQSIKKI